MSDAENFAPGRIDLERAASELEEVLARDPRHLAALVNLGLVRQTQRAFEAAFALYARALAVDPSCVAAYQNLGTVLADVGKLSEAIACFRRALELAPEHAGTRVDLAQALSRQGQPAQALRELAAALAREPRPEWHSNLLLTMHYLAATTPEQLLAEHRRWARVHAGAIAELPPVEAERDPERRLRIGYLSPDFRKHAVAFFLEGPLAAHDRAGFEIFGYSDVRAPDEVSARLEGLCDGWRVTAALGDDELCEQIRRDRIDILVDLAGHTAQNRLLTFARRPAPVQASWLGYPGTSGVSQIGWRLTDGWADPDGAERHATEQLMRLPSGFLCYTPPRDAPEPARAAGAPFTFGSFSNTAKISAEALIAWARILAALPEARLLLKFWTLDDGPTRERCLALLARHGVARERVLVRSGQWAHGAHLRAHAEVDVVLDPFPYNGTTTTCEALWMGVPVLTLRGGHHVARVGASLLARMGLDELVAGDADDYVARGVALAREPERVAALRGELRERTRAALCDRQRFTRELEEAYRKMWRRFCAG